MASPMSTLSPGRPRMTPLQRISMNATIIVTSPGFHVSLWPRAMIQVRMNGAAHAATSSQSSVENTSQALADSPFDAPGSQSDRRSTTAAPIPMSSPGDTLEKSRYPLRSSALASMTGKLHAGIGCAQPRGRSPLAVTKIIEVVGSSPESSDGAAKAALEDARQSLRNIKAVDVVSTGLRGENLDEGRALVRISFLVERV